MDTTPPPDDGIRELLVGFEAECGDLMGTFTAAIVAWPDATPDQRAGLVVTALRAMHTIKGTAMALQLPSITALSRAMEDVLDHARKTARDLGADERVLLLECGDALQLAVHAIVDDKVAPDLDQLVARLRGENLSPRSGGSSERAAHPQELGEPRPAAPDDDRTLRVPTDRLDALSALAADLLVMRSVGARREAEAQALVLSIEDMQRGSIAADASARASVSRVAARVGALHRAAVQDARRISVLTKQVIDAIADIRLVPMGVLVGQLRRAVHDAAARSGKDIELDVAGEHLELDKHVLDVLRAPLVHLVRNAVDHGIELAEERRAARKPRRGRISIRFTHRGDDVAVEIEDDGRGVDVRALADAAVAAGAIQRDQIAALGPDAALAMMTLPNVSTRKVTGDLSGRGLGLDIVRRDVEQVLRGSMACTTAAGRGTTFTIVAPLSIATLRALVLEVDGRTFALATSAVDYATQLVASDVTMIEGRASLRHRHGGYIEVFDLGAMLGLRPAARPLALAVRWGGRRAALALDRVHGEEEIVFKPFVPPLAHIGPVIGGAVVAGDEPLLVLGAAELLEIRAPSALDLRTPAVRRAPTILVVDDSITTRSLEANILRKHGFEVVVATNGGEALEAMKLARPDVIVSDIEMPDVDGYELCRRVRADHAIASIPIVLVSGLPSIEAKQRGLDAGADAYVEKGKFDQLEFLQLLRRYTAE